MNKINQVKELRGRSTLGKMVKQGLASEDWPSRPGAIEKIQLLSLFMNGGTMESLKAVMRSHLCFQKDHSKGRNKFELGELLKLEGSLDLARVQVRDDDVRNKEKTDFREIWEM